MLAQVYNLCLQITAVSDRSMTSTIQQTCASNVNKLILHSTYGNDCYFASNSQFGRNNGKDF